VTTPKEQTRSINGSRHYVVDGAHIPSVNTVDGLRNKPGLNGWLINQHIEAAYKNADHLRQMDYDTAKRFVRSSIGGSSKAVERGNRVHEVAEAFFRGESSDHPEAQWVVPHLQELCMARDIQPIRAEQTMVWMENDVPVLAGTTDLLARVNGVPTIMDWKTGKAIYSDSALTTGAYALMTHYLVDGETVPIPDDEKPIEAVVVHLTERYYEEHRVASIEALRPVWLGLIHLWHWQNNEPAFA
jgi:hypothetical protein